MKGYRDQIKSSLPCELEGPMAALHAWMHERIISDGLHNAAVKSLLHEATCLFGVLVNGAMWRLSSPYGRFVQGKPGRSYTPWWNTACSAALHRLRRSRGTKKYQHYRRHLNSVIALAQKCRWAKFVTKCESAGKLEKQHLRPKVHQLVKQGIRPKRVSNEVFK